MFFWSGISAEEKAAAFPDQISEITHSWLPHFGSFEEAERSLRRARHGSHYLPTLRLDENGEPLPDAREELNRCYVNPSDVATGAAYRLAGELLAAGKVLAFSRIAGAFRLLPVAPDSRNPLDDVFRAKASAFITSAEARRVNAPVKAGPKSGKDRGREREASEIVRKFGVSKAGARMRKADFIDALAVAGFSGKVAAGLWTDAAPDAWKVPGARPPHISGIEVSELAEALKAGLK